MQMELKGLITIKQSDWKTEDKQLDAILKEIEAYVKAKDYIEDFEICVNYED